jgi:adenine-specific DNA methylase
MPISNFLNTEEDNERLEKAKEELRRRKHEKRNF